MIKCYSVADLETRSNMSTTTIRIEDDLKARVAAAARIADKTTHAFVLDAISRTVDQVELDNALQAIADQRWAKIVATGKTVTWDETKTYLAARSRGARPRKPAARKLDR